MLEINGMTVAYGERLALRNFSLSMQEGEIVALVGESGSGKTTAIRSVLGLLPPGGAVTEGTISFEGQQLQGLSSREWKALRGKKLSMIFQDSGAMLNPIRTIGSQFREYIRTHSGLSKKEAGALSQEMLERIGIGKLIVVVGQRGRQRRKARSIHTCHCYIAHGFMIEDHKNCLPQGGIAQRAVEVHIRVAGADACGGGDIKAAICFQLLQITGGGDVFHQIYIPALEGHGFGSAVLDEKNRNGIVGNFSVPVIFVTG